MGFLPCPVLTEPRIAFQISAGHMESYRLSLVVVLTITILVTILIWGFWMAPWIRRNGRRSASTRDFIMNIALWVDLAKARSIAQTQGHYPWQLKLQLALVGIAVLCVIGLIAGFSN